MKFIFFFILMTQFSFAQTLMVSHKGAWKDHLYPQNSLLALKRAINHGFKGIEFDIFKSKDGKFILGHDDKINKVSSCNGKISQMLAQDLKKCLITKNTLLPITQILLKKVTEPQAFATLNEIKAELFNDTRVEFIWIDLKEQSLDVIAPLKKFISSINDNKVKEKIVINNGSADLLARLKIELPELRYSLEGKWGSEPLTDYPTYLDGIGTTHDMVSLNVGIYMGHEPLWKLICRSRRFWNYLDDYLTQAKAQGVKTIGWTVNRKKKIRTLMNMEIDYLLTDHLFPIKQ